MVDYVVGFCFNDDFTQVLLIEKDRPEWQAGLHNGVGGKIEPERSEGPHAAMVREFQEETGVITSTGDWHMISTLTMRSGEMVFVFGMINQEAFDDARTMESEPVHRVTVGDAWHGFVRTVASVPYLIELARYILNYQDLTVHIQTGEYVD